MLCLLWSRNAGICSEFCTEDNNIDFWNDLLAFDIPQACKDKIEDLGFDNQPIETGDVGTVNLDYYSITFDELPTDPSTDESFDDIKSFFEYFRINIADFIDHDVTHFEFLDAPLDDSELWESTEPLTSVFTINIPVGSDFTGDDGSVICSDFQDCCESAGHWVFSTIEAPDWGNNGANDGEHPVSGNRQFGFKENKNGSFTFYTKGADRANVHDFLKLFEFSENMASDAVYKGGHQCWSSLINGIEQFVDLSSVTEKYLNGDNLKPTWEKVLELLSSVDPITDIPCE